MATLDDYVDEFRDAEPMRQQVLLEEQRSAVTRAKSAQTRSITAAKRWVQNSATLPDDSILEALQESNEHVKSALKDLEKQVLKYINISDVKKEIEDLETDFVKRSEGAQDVCLAISKAIIELKAKLRDAAAIAAAPLPSAIGSSSSQQQQKARPISDLKPFKLEYETSPTGFKAWEEELEYYFQASNIHNEPTTVQQGYLYACLGNAVKLALKAKVSTETPVFGREGTSSCLATLRNVWLQRHPVFVRRIRYVNIKQEPGENASEMMDRIEAMAKHADVVTMSVEDWNTQIALNAINDKRISAKWMEQSEPDFAKLKEIVFSVESARAKTQKGASSETSSAKVFAQSQKTSSSGKGSTSSKSKESSSKKKGASASQCYLCGSNRHARREDCPVFQKGLLCHKCNKQGHLQKMCKGSSSAKKGGSGGSASAPTSQN
mgnify:CR=1 FL=1